MPDIFGKLFFGKRWLVYGSYLGGAIGALLMHLNEAMPVHDGLTLGMPMGLGLAVALGMIGGLIGGVIGCFIAGRIAKEDVVLSLGESLGVGLVNGFLAGIVMGLIMGFVHRLQPHVALFTNALLLFIGLAVMIIMIVVHRGSAS